MLSKYDQYSDSYSRCVANAQGRDGDVRTIWLSLAESYRMLLHYERKYPAITHYDSGQVDKSGSNESA